MKHVKNPSKELVVSYVLIIDWWRCCRSVRSPFSCHLVVYTMEVKSYKCHVNRMLVLIPVSSTMDMTQY